ncbi:MAG: thioredoxin domain-containing protein [Balneolales bacterium]
MSTNPKTSGRKPNRLIHETSPYLQQHAWNPVDWFPWGEEALGLARSRNRLIFLSIGYSSCHWCHVMEQESFENPEIARLLNEHFISIKVDREERPDIDAVYMEALQRMAGHGGWPLNVWLTPEQIPVFAGTYFPPSDLHGRPGFASVIRRLADLYHREPDQVHRQAREIHKALEHDLYDHLSPGKITRGLLDRAVQVYAHAYDEEFGGFSNAPKFPTSMGIGFLLKYSRQPGSDQALNMALASLEKMIRGGIYDQVGGGFHRYSTDQEWQVPHFEKMLYDNALLITSLAEAGLISGRPIFKEAVDETIRFLNREMRHPDGGYFSALDADSEGEEGKFYTYTDDELQRILDKDTFALVADYYGVGPAGNWNGVSILHRTTTLRKLAGRYKTPVEELEHRLEIAKKKILEYRNKRPRPGRDDKMITSWNALMLIALCRSTQLLGRDPADALRLGTYLAKHTLRDDTLYRITGPKGSSKQPAFLDDYALLADGFSRLFEITGEYLWLSRSLRLARMMLDQFYDQDKATFRYTSKNQRQLILETRDVFDHALPGGISAAITTLYRTGHLAGIPEWTHIAVKAMEPLSETAASHALAFGYLLQNMHAHCYPGREIVIVSNRPDTSAAAQKMVAIWREKFEPSSYLVVLPADIAQRNSGLQQASSGEAAFTKLYDDKVARNNKTTAYVCRNFSCRAPATTPEAFRTEMESSH